VEVGWWPEADSLEGRRGSGCPSPIRGAGVEVCVVDSVGAPYAANRLATLGRRGVWALGGDATPPDTAPCSHLCMSPGWLVVEARDARRYRTYGYGLPNFSDTAKSNPYALFWAY
jgi:hypothetical protein